MKQILFTGNGRLCPVLWRAWCRGVFSGVNGQQHVRRQSQCNRMGPCPDSTKGEGKKFMGGDDIFNSVNVPERSDYRNDCVKGKVLRKL